MPLTAAMSRARRVFGSNLAISFKIKSMIFERIEIIKKIKGRLDKTKRYDVLGLLCE